jgi:adenine deaminase
MGESLGVQRSPDACCGPWRRARTSSWRRPGSSATREYDTDIAIVDGLITAGRVREASVDASGRYVVPGFLDAHMHLESTKLLPDEFARLVLPLGTTAVVLDPHELANVLGTDGVHWLLDACEGLPLDFYFMASSSIPASRFESPRRPLLSGDPRPARAALRSPR